MLSKGVIKCGLVKDRSGAGSSFKRRMSGRIKTVIANCLVLGLCLGISGISHAAETKVSPNGETKSSVYREPKPTSPKETVAKKEKSTKGTVQAPTKEKKGTTYQNVKHIIVIAGHTSDKSKVTLNDYTLNSDGVWQKNWAVNGVCGEKGISAEKKEGDMKTPEGFFSPIMAFGIKDDPGSNMKYHKLETGDYWVDDSKSKYYNKLVNSYTTAKDWSSAEDMLNEAPYYNYGIALDYNKEGVPYKGSAIFIHCMKSDKDTGSAGCIRIPEDYMIKLIKETDENTKFFIISNQQTWFDYRDKGK